MNDSLTWVWIAVAFTAAVFLVNAWDVRSSRRDGEPVILWRVVGSGLVLLAIFPFAVWETVTELVGS